MCCCCLFFPTFAHHSTATKILFIHLTPCQWQGESLDFWNRGANNVQNFLWSEILRSQRCHLQVLKFRVGEIFLGSDLSSLQYLTPSHFLSIKVFSNWTDDHLRSLKKLVYLFGDLRKLLDFSNPVPKVKEFFPGISSDLD